MARQAKKSNSIPRIEIAENNRRCTCAKCGKTFATRSSHFAKSYSALTKGIGYMTICKDCLDKIYTDYLEACGDPSAAVRQTCRKLDLFWSENLFERAFAKSTVRTVMARYCTLLTNNSYAGLSYDDTLIGEGMLWESVPAVATVLPTPADEADASNNTDDDVDESIKVFWGSGYNADMYYELEARRKYWMSKFPPDIELDIGTEALIRQICSLELDINRDRAAGRSVEKSVTALNTLLGSANLKPAQNKSANDSGLENTPLGVWLFRYENKRPLPSDKYEDSKLLKYVFTWMGHLTKMLGLPSDKYSKMYEDEIDRLRVEKPEYEGDDEELFMDFMNGGDSDA